MPVDEDRLRRAVIAALRIKPDQYRSDLKLGDLDEWDSLGHLELVAHVEKEFGVTVALDDIPKLSSLGALRSHLAALGAGG
ncbi:MAG: acyl carrier protein [Proteobacteria bacterium]|nr:acyl carrier protein [Pseudomonadota bacterium]